MMDSKQISFDNMITLILNCKKIYWDFIQKYLGSYFSYKVNNNSLNLIINVHEVSNTLPLNVNGEYKNISIHYDQVAKVFEYDEKTVVCYEGMNHVIEFKKHEIDIYLQMNDDNKHYIPMRIIREIYRIVLECNGYRELHASSFVIDNKGFIVLGNKGMGKTTNLIRSIYSYKADFLSNDKTFVNINCGELYGYPMSLNVRKDIVNFVPSLSNLMDNPKHYQHIEWKEYRDNNKITLSLIELKDYLNFNIISKHAFDNVIIIDDYNEGEKHIVSRDKLSNYLSKFYRKTPFKEWENIIYTYIEDTINLVNESYEEKDTYNLLLTNKYIAFDNIKTF